MKLLTTCRVIMALTLSALSVGVMGQCTFNLKAEVISNTSCSGLSDGSVRADVIGSNYSEVNIGKLDTIGPGASGIYNFFDDGLDFDVYVDTVVITNVTVYPLGTGDIIVRILNSSSSVIFSDTFPVVGKNREATVLALNAVVPPGTDYEIDALGSTVTGLFRSASGGVSYPYSSSNVVLDITRGSNATNNYYFFYDWDITIKPSVSYSWSSGASTQVVTGLSAGTYTVTMTDNNSCSVTQTASVQIQNPDPFSLILDVDDYIYCYNENEGALYADVLGTEIDHTGVGRIGNIDGGTFGTFNYGLRFNVNSDSLTLNSCTVYPNGTGTLIINVKDSTNNVYWSTSEAISGATGNAVVINLGVTIPKGNDFTIDASGSAGITTMYRSFSNNAFPYKSPGRAMEITNSNFNNGAYYWFYNFSITEKQALSFAWSDSQSGILASNLNAGLYTVTITSSNGCSISDDILLEPPYFGPLATESIIYDEWFEPGVGYCAESPQFDNWFFFRDELDTSSLDFKEVVLSGSELPADLVCADDSLVDLIAGAMNNSDTIQVLCNGYYWRVIACNAAACSSIPENVTLSVNASPLNACACITGNALRPGIGNANWGGLNGNTCGASRATQNFRVEFKTHENIDDASCYGFANGAIYPLVSGGADFGGGESPFFSYLWSNTSTSQNLTAVSAGTYTVTITDDDGCTISQSYTIGQPDSLAIDLTIIHPSTNGGSDGQIAPIVSGGIAPYTFSWGDSSTDSNRTALSSSKYWLTVTDANNCSAYTDADLYYYENGILGGLTNLSGSANCLYFDGVDDYVFLPYYADPSTQSFTAEMWIRPLDFSSQRVLLRQDNGSGTGRRFLFIHTNKRLTTFIGGNNIFGATELDSLTWYHIAVTWDGSTVNLYVNGELDATATQTAVTADGQWRLGNYVGSPKHFGYMDEFRLWDTDLSESEIQGWMSQKLNDNHPSFGNLVLNYSFDQENSNQVVDISGNGNMGFMNNMYPTASWELSGAAIGDESKFTYPAAEIKDTMANGNVITINGFSGSPFGCQYYLVNDTAENSTFPFNSNSPDSATYFGVKIFGGGSYNIAVDFSNNPTFASSLVKHLIRVFKRENGRDGTWQTATGFFNVDEVNNIVYIYGQSGTEYVVGFAASGYPEEAGAGYAAQFDGTNDYMNLGSVTNYPFGNSARTVEAWVKVNEGAGNGEFFSYGTLASARGTFDLGVDNNGDFVIDIRTSFIIYEANLDDNQWHHLAASYPPGGNITTAQLYVDGVLLTNVMSSANTGFIPNTISNAGTIGSRSDAGLNFDGLIDEVRVWETNLDAATLRQYATQKVDASHPDFADLVGYYRMDDTLNGNAVYDLMGNNDAVYIDPDGVSAWVRSGANLGDTAFFRNPPSAVSTLTYQGNGVRTDNIQQTMGSISVYAVDDTVGGSFPNYFTFIDSTNFLGARSFNDSLFDLHYSYDLNPNFNAGDESQIRVLRRENGEESRWRPASGVFDIDQANNWIRVRNQKEGEYILGKAPNPLDNSLPGAGYSLKFNDGGGGGNEKVTATNSDLGNLHSTDPFTFECWIKTELNLSGYHFIFNSEESATAKMRLSLLNGAPRFTLRDLNNNALGLQFSDTLDDGEWHHLAFTYSGNEDRTGVRAYLDGEQIGGTTVNNAFTQSGFFADSIYIGNHAQGLNDFEGEIDEVRIWKAELPSSTINSWNYREINNTHPNITSLLSYYQFNEGSGSYTFDAAGGADGLLATGTTWQTSGAYIGDTMSYTAPAATANMSMDNGLSITVQNFEGAADAVVIYKVEDTASFSSIPPQIASAVTTSYFGVKLINGGTYDVEIDYSGNPTFASAAEEKNIRVLKRDDASDGTWEQVTSRIFVDVNNNKITIPGQSGTEYVIGFSNLTYPNRPGSGTALEFDGVNERVRSTTVPFNTDDNFTIEGWMKNNSTSGFKFAVALNLNIALGVQGTQYTYLTNNSSNTIGGGTPADSGIWNHVALVRRSGTYELYVNGELQTTPQGSTPNTPYTELNIGSKLTIEYWEGAIDEVRLWEAPLTQTNIRDWMCRKLTSDHDSINKLRAYYRFDESSGDTLYDLAMGNNAVLQNMEAADWITSNAALGDTSIYSYPGTDLTLVLPSSDTLQINIDDPVSGRHIYYINDTPNVTTYRPGVDTLFYPPYFGVYNTSNVQFNGYATYNSIGLSNEYEMNLVSRTNRNWTWSPIWAVLVNNDQANQRVNNIQSNNYSVEWMLASGSNYALNFDGVNDRMNASGSTLFNLGSEFTISFWIKPNNTSGGSQTIVGRFGSWYVIYEHTNDQVELLASSYTGDNPRTNSQIPITDNNWHFVSYTYDGETLRGYLDNSMVLEESKSFSIGTSLNALQVGHENGANFFAGSLDELRIWQRALCEGELMQTAYCETPVDQTNLSVYYDFDVGVPGGNNTGISTIPDQSVNALDGTLANFGLVAATSNITGGPEAVDTACTSFSVTPIVAAVVQDSALICFGDSTSATVSASGGSGIYTYVWSNGSDSTRAMDLEAGTHSVIITDGGCATPDTLTLTITQPDSLEISLSQSTAIICNGDNGVIGSTTLGGTTPYTYLWSNATTGDTLLAAAGSYSVTVTDANGCSDTASFNITEPTAVTASIATDNNVSCNGGSDGSLTVTASGGGGIYTYNWSSGGTAATETGLAAGTYTVTVYDFNGCSATDTRAVAEPSAVSVVTFGNNVTCNGGNDGSIIAVPSGGTGAHTFNWSNSGTANTITTLTAGTYTVTVSDANGCTGTASRTITEPTAISIALAIDSNASCNGFNDGGISATVGGGTGAYTYNWSSGGTSASETGLAAGTYTLTVTDANGCTNTSSTSITQPAALVASTVVDSNVTCNGLSDGGATASATGGTGAYTYAWSNGPTTAANPAIAAGTYTVTITDANGCSDTQTATITEPSALLATASTTADVSCNGGSDGTALALGAGGTTPYTYAWSNSATSAAISGLAAATYTVTISDANSCTATATTTVSEPTVLVATVGLDNNALCNGSSDGQATASAVGGTTPYTYSWSNGPTTATNSGIAAGTYTVTITDNNGCTDTDQLTITEPTAIAVGVTVDSNATCNGSTDGGLSSTPSGGTTPYTYLWSNAATTQNITGVGAGTYTVTVTDNNGCSITNSGTVIEPAALTATASTGANVSCNGGTDGWVSTVGGGGTLPYTYLWSNSSTSASPLGIPAGTYTVTITDANGCTATDNTVVTEPAALIASISVDSDVSCNGLSDGSLTASATGGTGAYTYAWSNGPTTAANTSLAAATYTVTITDANGCTDTQSATVTEPAVLVASVALDNNVSCNAGSDGGATASASGGTTPYTYAWSNSDVTASISGQAAGTYTVTITDNNGCTDTDQLTIIEPSSLTVSIPSTTDVSCSGGSDGSATATAFGGTTPYTYSWSDAQTTATATGLSVGTYTITVTDNNGCTATASDIINSPAPIATSTSVDSNVTCFGLSDGGVTVSAIGGTTPYTYVWSNAATTASITGLAAGTYTVTITDNNGCTATDTETVTQPLNLVATALESSSVSCNGGADGAATVTVLGGTSPYTYAWSNSGTTNSISPLSAGTYTVTVTDNNGCTDQSSVAVTEPTAILASISLDGNVSCNGFSDGGATASASGGTTPYTYAWSNGPTTAANSGLAAATYTVTITDNNGCTDTDNITITEPNALTASISQTNPISCNGGSNGQATVIPGGGTTPYTYLWDNAATSQNTSGISAGGFGVTVTDANGCSISVATIFTEPSAVVASAVVDSNVTCNGFADGGASASASGGTGAYTYLWSNSATTSFVTGVVAGTYTVTITDANGCTDVSSSTITEPTTLIASAIEDSSASCNGFSDGGASASATGGTAPYTYAWNTSATINYIDGQATGTYYVTITDANGCTDSASTTITEPAVLIAATPVDNDVSCNGGSDGSITANGSGGTAPYTYAWSNGPTTANNSGLAVGTYTVTITDANGCTDDASATINQPAALSASVVIDSNATCNGDSDAGVSASVSGGTAPYTYLWDDDANSTTQSVAGLNAGPISVTVTDNNGCTIGAANIVTEPALISMTLVVDSTISCNGLSDGGATISLISGGDGGPYNYLWSNSSTNNFITGVVAGTYTVTATDGNGCTGTASTTITEPAPLASGISASDVICANDGIVSTSVSGGTSPYTYLWDDASTASSITGLDSGRYYVTITDANGCSITANDSVGLGINVPKITFTTTDVACFGQSTGSIIVNVTDGTAPYNFTWADIGAGPGIRTLLATGTYFVTVTGNLGCTAASSTTLTQPGSSIVASAIVDSNATCNGFTNGGASSSATGGVAPYTYAWSNSATTSFIDGVGAGTYTVTISDNNGCTDTDQVTILEPSAITAVSSVDSTVSCNGLSDGGASTAAGGGIPPYTYSWNTAATTSFITGVSAGTYTVTITDNNGCTTVDGVSISEPTALAASFSNTNVNCNGGLDGMIDLTASGGTSPYTYLWSNSANIEDLTALGAGTYTVTITDNNGCTYSSSTTVTEPTALIASATVDNNITCDGDADGQATASATGGTAPYTYSWSNAATTATTSSLDSGSYYVTITDANGCMDSASVSIAEPDPVDVTQFFLRSPDCNGANTGRIWMTYTGGTSPYTFNWSNATTNDTLFDVTAGTYTVTITDANGCTYSTQGTLVDPPAMTVSIALDSSINCFGGSDGGITATAGGGQVAIGNGVYSYVWSNSATDSNITALSAGTYTVTASDYTGCTATATYVLGEPADITTSFTIDSTVSCNGFADGGATVSPAGGTGAYTYLWSNSATTNFITGVAAGTYTVTITDANGCTDVSSTTITEPAALIASAIVDNDITCKDDADGQATASATGGTAPYTYAWSNAAATATTSSLDSGSYYVTITDANGCTDSASVSIAEPDSLIASVVLTNNVSCNGLSDGVGTASATGGTTPYTYSWSNGATTAAATDAAGTYYVTITDANGCTDSANVTITEPVVLTAFIVPPINESCVGANDGAATAAATGGTSPYTYAWSNSATASNITGLGAGTYTVTITDANGCTDATSTTIIVNDVTPPTAIAQSITIYLDASGLATIDSNAVDNGSNDNCAIAAIITDSTNFDCSETGANIVEMIAFDSNGNSDTTTATVTVLDSTKPSMIAQNISIYLDNLGLASITTGDIDNGSTDNCGPPSLSLDSTNFDCSEVGPNTVYLRGIDPSGNQDSAMATVTVFDTVRPTVLTNNITIYLDPAGTASIVVNDIDNGSTDACGIATRVLSQTNFDCSHVGPNTVTLTVTDNNSNVDSATATVTVLDTLRPIVVTQPITIYLDASGFASIDSNAVDNGSNDNCAIVEFRTDSTNFDCTEVGANTVEMIVEDGSANTDTASATVTVIDSVRPDVFTNNITIYLDNAGQASITVNDIDNSSSDACGIATRTVDSTNFDCSEVGPNTVTLTVTDNNGNVDSATATVTVIDTVRPNVLTNNITIYLDPAGTASIVVNDINNGSSDACGIATRVLNQTNFDCSHVGPNAVTLTVTDNNSNVDSATATVTVLDTLRPIAITQPITIYLDASGQANIDSNAVDNGSNDNCAIVEFRTDSTNFDCSEVGSNTVEMIVEDGSANTDTATATVTVIDSVRPDVFTNNITIYLDNAGQASITVNDIDNSSSDACGIATRTLDSINFDCSEVGPNTVTLTVTDNNGNVDSATATVTVIDTVRPVAIAQPITIYLDGAGMASIDSNDVDNGSTDNCQIASITTDITNFTCNEVGVNNVEMLVIDVNGNRDSAGTTVTVIDTVRPVAITQPISVYLDASGLASIDSYAVDNGSSDNCQIDYFATDSTNFDCTEVGSNTVEMLVVDVNGNRDSTTATVTVIDTVRPNVLTNNITVYLDPAGTASIVVNDIDNGSSDACGIATRVLSQTNFDCSHVGPNTVTLTVTDNNSNVDSATATVTVLDTLRPIAITQPITIYLDASGFASIDSNAVDNGSNDNCAIVEFRTDSTNFDCTEVGSNTVEMIVEDGSANTDTATATVTVIDSVRPDVFTNNITIYLDNAGQASITVNDIDNSSSDACGIATRTLDSTNFDCSEVGPNTVTLTVTDNNGNVDSATASVTVIDSVRPTVLTNNITIYLDPAGTASIVVNDIDNGSSDACGIATRVLSQTNFDCSHVGPNTVTLTVTDNNSNVDSATATVTVLDTLRPIAITQPITIYLDASGFASIDSNAVDNGSNDNCQIAYFATDSTNFDCSEVGPNTVELLVVDVNGNRDSTTATVNVVDSVRPDVFTNNITIYLDNAGQASITVNDIDNSSSDACGIATRTLDSTNFDCSEVGMNTVSLTVTDNNGNVDSATAVVTVLDTVRPMAIAFMDTTLYLDINGQISIAAMDLDSATSDACGIDTLIISQENFSCVDTGLNIINFLAIDNNLNRDSVNVNVTILDTIRPDVFPGDTVLYLDASGLASLTALDVDSASTDNCGIAARALNQTAFTCSDVGVNLLTLTLTDDNGNIDSAIVKVEVVDTVRPEPLAYMDTTLYLDNSGLVSITAQDLDSATADACGISSISISQSSFSCLDTGLNVIRFVAVDNNQNSDSMNVNVTVLDTVRPNVLANDTTVYLDINGLASLTAISMDDGSTDNCQIATYELDSTNFDCTAAGSTFEVVLTVTDVSGNSDTSRAYVTVEDTIRPDVFPGDTVLYLDVNGLASLTALDVDSASTDNCGIATRALSQTAFDCSDVGVNLLTLTITDVNGRIDSATVKVEVVDSVRPEPLAFMDTTLYLDGTGNVSITAQDLDSATTDACGISSISISQSSFSCLDTGLNVIRFVAVDNNQNSDSMNVNVTVLDTVRPNVLANDTTVYLDINGLASLTAISMDDGSTDNCQIATYELDSTNFDCTAAGSTFEVVLTVTDVSGNSDTSRAYVTVEDTIRPDVFPNDTVLYLDVNGLASLTALDADSASTDNCGIATRTLSQTAFDCSDVGVNLLTLTITDVNGRIDSATVKVEVVDSVRPEPLAFMDTTLYLDGTGNVSITAQDLDSATTDACGISSISISQSSFSCLDTGLNVIRFVAVDNNQNSDSMSVNVTVLDTVRPNVLANDTTVYLDINGLGSLTAISMDDGSTDNCQIATYELDSTNFDCTAAGSTFEVVLTVTDVSGNSDTSRAYVTVEDTTRPNVIVQNITVYLDNTGNASIIPADIDNGTSDNCSLQPLTIDVSSFTCSELGNNAVTLTAIDVNGNSNAAIATVNVVDTLVPTASTAGNDTTVCASVDTLKANAPSIGSGVWTVVQGSAVVTNPSDPRSEVTNLSVGDNILVWSITTTACNNSIDTVVISRDAQPTVAFAGDDILICDVTSVNMNAAPLTIGSGSWTLLNGNGTIVNSSSRTTVINNLAIGVNRLAWTVSNGVCPSTSDTLDISVSNTPIIDAGDDQSVFLQDGAQLGVASDVTQGVTYSWSPASYIEGSASIANPFAKPPVTTTFTVIVTDSLGCEATASVYIEVEGGLEIPSAFTPNNDGFNDTWEVKNLGSYAKYTVTIYNGYGNEIFSTSDYTEPWDGTFNGSVLNVGSYYYVIQLEDMDGKSSVETGIVTIIK